ncbi:MAG: 50S ribosomal protein L16 [Thermoproteaceae archaeon]|nr:50S ribosomal protein L16 [Thermoproteaceae archaeon]
MPQRPGRCYRRIKGPPYARAEYIHGAPVIQIPKFDMGAASAAERARLTMVAKLVSRERGQIRMQALEAARQAAYRYLSGRIGDANFYLRLNVVPHHVLRENRMLAMAGADRLQEGMRLAFGTPVGRAARVEPGQVVMYIEFMPEHAGHAKEALRRAASKLPLPMRIVIEPKAAGKDGGGKAAVQG